MRKPCFGPEHFHERLVLSLTPHSTTKMSSNPIVCLDCAANGKVIGRIKIEVRGIPEVPAMSS